MHLLRGGPESFARSFGIAQRLNEESNSAAHREALGGTRASAETRGARQRGRGSVPGPVPRMQLAPTRPAVAALAAQQHPALNKDPSPAQLLESVREVEVTLDMAPVHLLYPPSPPAAVATLTSRASSNVSDSHHAPCAGADTVVDTESDPRAQAATDSAAGSSPLVTVEDLSTVGLGVRLQSTRQPWAPAVVAAFRQGRAGQGQDKGRGKGQGQEQASAAKGVVLGPVERSGVVAVGAVVSRINGESTLGQEFNGVVGRIGSLLQGERRRAKRAAAALAAAATTTDVDIVQLPCPPTLAFFVRSVGFDDANDDDPLASAGASASDVDIVMALEELEEAELRRQRQMERAERGEASAMVSDSSSSSNDTATAIMISSSNSSSSNASNITAAAATTSSSSVQNGAGSAESLSAVDADNACDLAARKLVLCQLHEPGIAGAARRRQLLHAQNSAQRRAAELCCLCRSRREKRRARRALRLQRRHSFRQRCNNAAVGTSSSATSATDTRGNQNDAKIDSGPSRDGTSCIGGAKAGASAECNVQEKQPQTQGATGMHEQVQDMLQQTGAVHQPQSTGTMRLDMDMEASTLSGGDDDDDLPRSSACESEALVMDWGLDVFELAQEMLRSAYIERQRRQQLALAQERKEQAATAARAQLLQQRQQHQQHLLPSFGHTSQSKPSQRKYHSLAEAEAALAVSRVQSAPPPPQPQQKAQQRDAAVNDASSSFAISSVAAHDNTADTTVTSTDDARTNVIADVKGGDVLQGNEALSTASSAGGTRTDNSASQGSDLEQAPASVGADPVMSPEFLETVARSLAATVQAPVSLHLMHAVESEVAGGRTASLLRCTSTTAAAWWGSDTLPGVDVAEGNVASDGTDALASAGSSTGGTSVGGGREGTLRRYLTIRNAFFAAFAPDPTPMLPEEYTFSLGQRGGSSVDAGVGTTSCRTNSFAVEVGGTMISVPLSAFSPHLRGFDGDIGKHSKWWAHAADALVRGIGQVATHGASPTAMFEAVLRCRHALQNALADEILQVHGRHARESKPFTLAAEQLLPCFVALVAAAKMPAPTPQPTAATTAVTAALAPATPPWVTSVSFLRAHLLSAPYAREAKAEIGYFTTTLEAAVGFLERSAHGHRRAFGRLATQLRAASEDGGLPDASEHVDNEPSVGSCDGSVNGDNTSDGVADAVAVPSVQRWSRPQQLHEEVWANGSSIVAWLHKHVISEFDSRPGAGTQSSAEADAAAVADTSESASTEPQSAPEQGAVGQTNSQTSWYRCDASFALARQLGALGLLSVVRTGSFTVEPASVFVGEGVDACGDNETGSAERTRARMCSNIAFTHSTFRVNVPPADVYDSDNSSDDEDQGVGEAEQISAPQPSPHTPSHEGAQGQKERGQDAQGHNHAGTPGTRARARSEGSKRHS